MPVLNMNPKPSGAITCWPDSSTSSTFKSPRTSVATVETPSSIDSTQLVPFLQLTPNLHYNGRADYLHKADCQSHSSLVRDDLVFQLCTQSIRFHINAVEGIDAAFNHFINPLTLPRLNKSRAHRVLWLLEELNVDYDLKVYKRGDDMVSHLGIQLH